MNFAEKSIINGRDDKHMIYEMFHLSQYQDGSVLDCLKTRTYEAQQVAEGACDTLHSDKRIVGDLKRNAKAAQKSSKTGNLAPLV